MCYSLSKAIVPIEDGIMTNKQIEDLAIKIISGVLTKEEAEQIINNYHNRQ